MLARQRALRIALAEARDGVLEKREDFSKRIRQYQAADSEPAKTGYAWCNSFVDWCFQEARRELEETNRSAFVPTTAALADKKGWVARKPAAGDLVCFQFDDDANLDHIGFVLEVNRDGSVRTVEGNTVGDSGGEGVFVKTRARSLCCVFIRVPGQVPDGIGRGDHGGEVRDLQNRLIELGHKKLEIDGEFGEKTEKAVETFQSRNDLAETGVANTKTLKAIDQTLESEKPEPRPTPRPSAKPTFVVTAAFPGSGPRQVEGLATRTALNKQVGAFLNEGARFVQISPER
jgi:Putative peptidoglycan binding domain/CHAP domain